MSEINNKLTMKIKKNNSTLKEFTGLNDITDSVSYIKFNND